MNKRVHVGVFASPHELLAAARECRELGLRLEDAYSPFPVHGLEKLFGIRRTRLPYVCFLGGLAGVIIGLWFQFWATETSWPLNVGGKPFNSLPAFVPVIFEMMVLLGGLSTAFGLWLRCRLLPGARPRRVIPGVTDDRFAILVSHRGAEVEPEQVGALLRRHGALETWEELEELR